MKEGRKTALLSIIIGLDYETTSFALDCKDVHILSPGISRTSRFGESGTTIRTVGVGNLITPH